jgi:hypothetical protein
MAKNKLSDLRDHLFETLEQLKDKDSGMTIEKAKAVADISQVIINTSKLEIEAVKIIDKLDGFYPALSNGFIETEKKNILDK